MYGRLLATVSLGCALLGSSLPAHAQPMPTYDPDGRYSGGQMTGRRYELFGGMSYTGAIRRETVTAPGKYAPGTIIAVGREGIDVVCGPETNPGVLRLIALQPAAGRTMSAHAFATGRGMAPGHSFEAGR